MCFLIFEKRILLLPFLNAILYKSNRNSKYLNPIKYKSAKPLQKNKTIDVLIPTIGRKEHLYNVLKDLANQTILPNNVIIIEQSTGEPFTSDLDYLTSHSWPFIIKHKFTNNTGVCKARNLGLKEVESDWCFFADDDIRFEPTLIENVFLRIDKLGVEVLNLLCLQPHENQTYFNINQTDIFGSGTSIVKSSYLKKTIFDTSFEFGFGEDSDFGMQLRKLGADVIYIPDVKITHLKAPIGGFRTKHISKWEEDKIQPKPSPTLMVFITKHYNSFQKNGYKYVLFLKFYKSQTIKNPFKYLKQIQKQWNASIYWSEQLKAK